MNEPLITKYRPTKFEDFFGNEKSVEQVKGQLSGDSIPKVWLFTGDAGSGKTTMARIVANSVCKNPQAVREMNSANYRGIDHARQIAESDRPLGFGSYLLAYIMDECHQLTKDSQNALLKVFEEPTHTYILCTSEPQKLLPAVRSRCKGSTFHFPPISEDASIDLVSHVIRKENLKNYDSDMIAEIAFRARGKPRELVGLVGRCRDCKTLEDIREVLAESPVSFDPKELADELANALWAADTPAQLWRRCSSVISRAQGMTDWKNLADDLRHNLVRRLEKSSRILPDLIAVLRSSQRADYMLREDFVLFIMELCASIGEHRNQE